MGRGVAYPTQGYGLHNLLLIGRRPIEGDRPLTTGTERPFLWALNTST